MFSSPRLRNEILQMLLKFTFLPPDLIPFPHTERQCSQNLVYIISKNLFITSFYAPICKQYCLCFQIFNLLLYYTTRFFKFCNLLLKKTRKIVFLSFIHVSTFVFSFHRLSTQMNKIQFNYPLFSTVSHGFHFSHNYK